MYDQPSLCKNPLKLDDSRQTGSPDGLEASISSFSSDIPQKRTTLLFATSLFTFRCARRSKVALSMPARHGGTKTLSNSTVNLALNAAVTQSIPRSFMSPRS